MQVVRVEQKDVPVYDEWIGSTEGITNADIKPQVSGYLLRQDYKEGSFVKKGQLLFEIDPRPFQAALDQAQGQLAQFLGQLEQVSSQVKQAEAQVAQANSQLLQAQAQLAQAQANQIKTLLDVNKYAPLLEQKCIERALAGIGSTHPEELREHPRKMLTIERTGLQILLKYENHNLRASVRDFAINLTRSRSTLAMFQPQSQCVLLDVLDSSRTFTRKVIGIAVAPSIREAESDLRIMMSSDAATW